MKRLLLPALLVCCGLSLAQTNPNCVGLNNPTNFIISGNHGETWTGYTGSRESTPANCNFDNATYTNTVQASGLEIINNYDGCNINLDNGSTRTTSRDINNNLDHSRQFVIKGAGYDPETYGHLSYLPPDTSIHSSIRLGNYCGMHGAEKLTYQIIVRPDNSIITLWIALSMLNGQHSGGENCSFKITVERNIGSISSPNWVPLAGDTLCYIKMVPDGYQADTSFRIGANGLIFAENDQSLYNKNIYLPWRRFLLDLSNYIYSTIRISIAVDDGAVAAQYGTAYIAGNCHSSNFDVKQCVSGETSTVATIYAPKGGTHYEWYRSNSGILTGEALNNESNYTLIPEQNYDSLDCKRINFVNTTSGDTMVSNTFMCKMTTQFNNSPVVTKHHITVGLKKPNTVVDTTLDCSGTIHLTNLSYTPYITDISDAVDTSLTEWRFYGTITPIPQSLIATYAGGQASHTFAQTGNYSVKVRTFAANTNCWNEETIRIRALKPPVPQISLSREKLCGSDTILVSNTTTEATYHDWTIVGRGGETTNIITSTPTLQLTSDTTTSITLLTRTNRHYLNDTNNDGTPDFIYCFADTTFTINHSNNSYAFDTILVTPEQFPYVYNGETYDAPGDYIVILPNQQGCDSIISIHINSNNEGIDPTQAINSIKIQPNPTNGLVSIAADDIKAIEVLDAAGRKVFSAQQTNTVDLGSLPNGTYLMRIITPSGTATRKVTKTN